MKINKTILFAASALLVFTASCEKPEKNPAPYDVGIDAVPTGAFLSTLEVTANEINISDVAGSSFGVNLEHNDADNGNLLQDVNVYLKLDDNSQEDGSDVSKAEVLYQTIAASEFSTGNNPVLNYLDSTGDAVTFFGLTTDQIGPGDVFTYRFEVNLTSGLSFSAANTNANIISGPAYQSPFVYKATVVCPPVTPAAGDWIFDMADAYGDGWNGASLSVLLDGVETVFLVEAAEATETLTVPEGVEVMSIKFVSGAWNGEISFTITSANGNVIATQESYSAADPVAGEELINYCILNY